MSSSSSSNGQNNNNNSNNQTGNNNNRQNVSNNNNNNRFASSRTTTSFVGSCPELKGHTITSSDAGPNSTQYEPFNKAIIQMAGRFDHEPSDIKNAVENLQDPAIPSPKTYDVIEAEVIQQFGGKAPTSAEAMKFSIFEKTISNALASEQTQYSKRVKALNDNKTKVISAALAQCDEGILRAIERYDDYEQEKDNMYWILKKIRLTSKSPTSCSPDNLERTSQLLNDVLGCRQGRSTLSNYLNRFNSIVQTMEDEDAVPVFARITKKAAEWKPGVTEGSEDAQKAGQEAFFAHLFINNANYIDFEDWRLDLARTVETQGEKVRPTSVQAAYQRMEKELIRKGKTANSTGSSRGTRNEGTVMALTGGNSSGGSNGGRSSGHASSTRGSGGNSSGRGSGAQEGRSNRSGRGGTPSNSTSSGASSNSSSSGASGNNRDASSTTRRCLICGSTDHSEQACEDRYEARAARGEVSVNRIDATNLAQRLNVKISPNLIVIDSASSCHIFMSENLIHGRLNHKQAGIDEELTLYSNGGSMKCKSVCKFENLQERVWYDRRSIANILSLALLVKERRVFFDSAAQNEFLVFRGDGSVMRFVDAGQGLYVHNVNDNKMTLHDVVLQSSPIIPVSLNQVHLKIPTVESNMQGYTPRQIKRAKLAREQMGILGFPTQKDHEAYIENNFIHNSPVTIEDIRIAYDIFGESIPALKGKTKRRKPAIVPNTPLLRLPHKLYKNIRNVFLCCDFVSVNGVVFFVSKSRNISFATIRPVDNRKADTMINETTRIINKYDKRGLDVNEIFADNEFHPIIDAVAPIHVNLAAAGEHVGDIENFNKVLQERMRCIWHTVPYGLCWPRIMVIALAEYVTRMLNAFPSKTGVSSHLSPSTIVEGRRPLDASKLTLAFGEFVQLTIDTNFPTNTVKQRTVDAICLGPSGNTQGTYTFMSLDTGRRLHGRSWKVCIPDQSVIDRVHELGRKQHMPEMDNGPIVAHRPRVPMPIYDDDNSDTSVSTADTVEPPLLYHDRDDTSIQSDHTDIDHDQGAQIIGEGDDVESIGGGDDVESINDGDDEESIGGGDDEESINNGDEEESISNGDDEGNIEEESDVDSDEESIPSLNNDVDLYSDSDSEDDSVADTNNEEVDLAEEFEREQREFEEELNALDTRIESIEAASSEEESTNGNGELEVELEQAQQHFEERNDPQGMRLRSNRVLPGLKDELSMFQQTKEWEDFKSNHAHMFAQAEKKPPPTFKEITEGADYTINELRDATYRHVCTQLLFRKATHIPGTIQAVHKEYAQLDNKQVYTMPDQDELTNEQKKGALNPVDLVEFKRDGRIKGRSCVDGRPQREYTPREECASPTMANESLMIIAAIAAKEKRDVATADVAGAYLNADMDDFVLVKFTGRALQIICEVNPSFKAGIRKEKGRDVLYLKLAKALYGCLKSALLWYKLFKGTLEKMGFKLNRYDPCVANKDIKGKQCTIGWWVDDNFISHKRPTVVDGVIDSIEQRFGKMSVTRGDQHVFLGMNMRFPGDGTVRIHTKDYIREAAETFGEPLTRKIASPATKGLFDLDEEPTELNEDKAAKFRSVVMKLQWVAERGRPDIRLPIAYLATRNQSCTDHDWWKLRRVLLFLMDTIDDERIIGADDLGVLHTWIDSSYATHPDMRSHTGGVMSFGTGVIHARSNKQKINTKSSTEAEVVGVSDYLPFNIWVRMFMEDQGYKLRKNIIYQDNESAIRLEKNGRMSCGQKSRHINIRYFFITDRIKAGEVSVQHCPTEAMLADFFTKPLQGGLFHRFREVIMGWKPITSLEEFGFKY